MDTGIRATFTGTLEDKKLFTPAEWKVLLLHCEGYTKKAIADYVCRSPDTVKTQESSIRDKSQTKTMAHAMLKWIAKGIITVSTLCLVFISSYYYFKITNELMDTKRAPRIARSLYKSRRVFRDYLV